MDPEKVNGSRKFSARELASGLAVEGGRSYA